MFKNLFTKKSTSTISIYLGMQKVAICEDKNGQQMLTAGEIIKSNAEWPGVIKKMVTRHDLQGMQANVVVGQDFYQSFDVDKPNIEGKELLASLPFTIKELVAESVVDLIVDYYDKPPQARKEDQMTVVSMSKSRIIGIREMLSDSEITLNAVTVEETAVCSLLEKSAEANVILYQQESELVLAVVKDEQLYFSLRIRGYNELLPLALSETENALVDGLSLEIQRALDYVSSQLQINNIDKLYLALQCPDIALLANKLGSYIDKDVLPLSEKFNYGYLLAYGGLSKELMK